MGKVDCFEISGIEVYFNSSDHLPPHFHAGKPGEWGIRVYLQTTTSDFLDYKVIWPLGGGPRAPVLKELRESVIAHREDLLLEWERKVNPR
jgi:hypothetical protein